MEASATATSTTSVGVRYGLLTGLIGVILSFIVNALHLELSPARHIIWAVLISGIILAQRNFKQQRSGFLNYAQGLGLGMVVTTVFGLITAVFTYIYANFLDQEIVMRAIQNERAKMEARGNLSDAQIEQAMSLVVKFMSGPVLIVIIILLTVFFGLVTSLISSAVLKNPKPEFE